PMRKDPEVVTVTLKKHNGMGLSIVAAKVRKHLIMLVHWRCGGF
ncbi:afadin, partial [Tachysurus ichikawai]